MPLLPLKFSPEYEAHHILFHNSWNLTILNVLSSLLNVIKIVESPGRNGMWKWKKINQHLENGPSWPIHLQAKLCNSNYLLWASAQAESLGNTEEKKIQTTEHISKWYHDNPIVDAAYQSWPCSLLAVVELPCCGTVFNTGCHRRKQPLRN